MKNILFLIPVLIFLASCSGGGNNSETATKTCVAGAFNCKDNALMQCENNEWQKIEECAESQKCNPVKGICENIDGDITPENPDTDDVDTNQDTDTDSSDTKPENPDTDDADTSTQENPDTDDTDPSTDDGDSEAVEINDEASCIEAGGAWSSGKCTKSVSCTGLPENAIWNKTTGIRQTWNGTEWEPSEIGSYSETTSTTECVFKCKANYEWNEETSTCDAATQTVLCTGLPANAVWNTVSEITQTWSGSAWLPSATGTYDETESEEECRFKCATNYTWNGSSCAADTRIADCSSKPANTVWNDNDKNGKFTQTWNGSDWAPATYASGFSKAAGTCKYVCTAGYIWSDNQCITAPTQTASCTGLPANAQWNTASSITQTYDGSEWFPGTTGVYNETASTTECRFKCNTNYNWNSSTSKCVAATQTANCTGLPANAEWWNGTSTFTQTWNGTGWTPSPAGSYGTSAGTCKYKCKTNYNWNSSTSTCVAATQQGSCSSKPANTAWNDNGTNGKFTQTWDGSAWMPTSYTSTYSKTAGTCRYVCATGYIWSDNQCITAPTQTASCTGLPANAQWNTASSITQTYDGSEWYPSTSGTYNTTASTSECRYKCKEHYSWKNSQCVADTQSANCTGLPANAQWNTASSITQTWNGSAWTPTATGSFNNTASTTECRFKCNTNYNWSSSTSTCDAAKQTVNCTEKPANTVWNTVSTVTQTWTGSAWSPSNTSTYNETASTNACRYKCDSTHYWYNSECTSPCDYSPCEEVANSTHVCTATSWNNYSCECSGGYYWHGKTEGCKADPATLGNICTAQNKCYDNSAEITCPTSSTADFFGQDAYYASLGKCTPQSFTVQTVSNKKVVVDNNTGLMWQQTIPTGKYWDDAVSYCNGLSYAGYTDWRLPTPQELLTIVDNSRYSPAIDTTYFPNTLSGSFWSSSASVNNTDIAWPVGFSDGYVDYSPKTNPYYVRCVRGNELPKSTFSTSTANGDVIVTDTKTGLVWQKTYKSGKTWQEALDYCEDLTYAGYSDWRLPDKNELASLVNYEKYNPASDFPDMPPSSYFWSSSTNVDDTDRAWHVYFGIGFVKNNGKTNTDYVRCVR